MIVSHRHRFIFLKTRKTAGSSVEMALRPFLGADDIATQLEEDDTHDLPPPRNYVRGREKLTPRNIWRVLRGKPLKPYLFKSHESAVVIRGHVGEDVWQSYFKFCFERNPWDRQVSQYHFKVSRDRYDVPFDRSLGRRTSYVDNWGIYTIDGEIAVDRVFHFENLKDDFAEACRIIGLSPVPELPHAKSGLRPKKGYRSYYDDRLRDEVAKMYPNEIEKFGYTF